MCGKTEINSEVRARGFTYYWKYAQTSLKSMGHMNVSWGPYSLLFIAVQHYHLKWSSFRGQFIKVIMRLTGVQLEGWKPRRTIFFQIIPFSIYRFRFE